MASLCKVHLITLAQNDKRRLKSINIPGVPKKVKSLIDHRTKDFCSIIKFSFDFNSNLDFETKFAQMRYELTKIHKFES